MPRNIAIKAADIRAAVEQTINLAQQYRSVLLLVDTLRQADAVEQYITDTNLAADVARSELEKAQQEAAAASQSAEDQIRRCEAVEAEAIAKIEAEESKLAAFEADAKTRTEVVTAETLAKIKTEEAELAAFVAGATAQREAATAELQRQEIALAAARADAAALAAKWEV